MVQTSRMGVDNPLVTQEDLMDHTGVGMIVYNKNKTKILLFHHRKYNFWTIPIGKVESPATHYQTAVSELFEETDIKLTSQDIKFLGSFYKTYNRGNGLKTKINQMLFEVLSYTGKPRNKEPDKHYKMKWLTFSEINHLKFTEEGISDLTKFMLLIKS